MQSVDYYLGEYARDHQNPVNQAFHRVCVPLIVISLLGLLWSLPVPEVFAAGSRFINWATALIACAMLYYTRLSPRLALGMLPVMVINIGIVVWLETLPWALWKISAAIFTIAWIGQFIGHIAEGKRPSFFRDLQFLLIGPLWLLAGAYQRLEIDVSPVTSDGRAAK